MYKKKKKTKNTKTEIKIKDSKTPSYHRITIYKYIYRYYVNENDDWALRRPCGGGCERRFIDGATAKV